MPSHPYANVGPANLFTLLDTEADRRHSGGMSHLPDLLKQLRESSRNANCYSEKVGDRANSTHTGHVRTENSNDGQDLWCGATEALIEPAHALITAVNDGLEHAGLQLGIIHRRFERGVGLKNKDAESRGSMTQPGDPAFSAYLEQKLNEFSHGRLQSLSAWTAENEFSEDEEAGSEKPSNYRQLNLILYIQQMVSETLRQRRATLTIHTIALFDWCGCA